MTVSLTKGGNVSLTKTAPGLDKIVVGLGWDVNSSGGATYDLDASILMLHEDGKLHNKKDLVYYGNPSSPNKSIVHTGDNLTGEGEGDDEQLIVELNKVPSDIVKLLVVVSIYKAREKKQNFGQVDNAFVRIVNGKNNEELTKYDLGEEFSNELSMIFGEIYRYNGEWKFKAIGQGIDGELGELVSKYGF